ARGAGGETQRDRSATPRALPGVHRVQRPGLSHGRARPGAGGQECGGRGGDGLPPAASKEISPETPPVPPAPVPGRPGGENPRLSACRRLDVEDDVRNRPSTAQPCGIREKHEFSRASCKREKRAFSTSVTGRRVLRASVNR